MSLPSYFSSFAFSNRSRSIVLTLSASSLNKQQDSKCNRNEDSEDDANNQTGVEGITGAWVSINDMKDER